MRYLLLVVFSIMCLTSACSWVGKNTGKAVAKVERKVDSLEQGYKDGYQQEQKK
ncbi:hypothetical protein [Desulfovibrio litoralis]|uniref:Entericidin EcnA/B family protein n=1 Tax=Desulfovibrio litoralis DSM 11393 TaxID=1121455 RepID=A0A1M7STR1_9BACT|nr:hypothetical protein [Desulfovibrio litoralis]SHN61770.1 hypothetical protein SAMN02745728_01261 [Desulfovibrio litoralis DSM 11393]